MAETIRDLAFKVSLNMNLAGLKSANSQVTNFRNNVTNMVRNVSKNVNMVNQNLNSIRTFKAVSRINKIGEAIDKVKAKSKESGVGMASAHGSGVDPAFKGKKGNAVYGTSPYGYQVNRLNAMVLTSTRLVVAGIHGLQLKSLQSKAQSLKLDKDILSNLTRQKSERKAMISNLKEIRDLLGKAKYNALGGAKGLANMAKSAISLFATMRMVRGLFGVANKSIDEYEYKLEGLTRQETFFATALKFREKTVQGMAKSGAKSFDEFKQASANSLAEARKNIQAVTQEGVISSRALGLAVGQLASFQIDTDAWFGGEKGRANLESIADLASAVYGPKATKGNMINIANMIGKADALSLFGQMQRWGIVLTDAQKKIIKTGNETERLGAIMEGLEQNVGGLNKAMGKTVSGAYYKQLNKYNELMADLGETAMRIKTAFLKLYIAIFPLISGPIEILGPILAVISDGVATFFNAINKLNPELLKILGTILAMRVAMPMLGTLFNGLLGPILNMVGLGNVFTKQGMTKIASTMNGGVLAMFIPFKKWFGKMPKFMKTGFAKMLTPFRWFFGAIGKVLALFGIQVNTAFWPITIAVLAIGLIVQDLWTVFHGGKGITGGLVKQLKILWKSTKTIREEFMKLFNAIGGMDTVKNVFAASMTAIMSPIIITIKAIELLIWTINKMVEGAKWLSERFGGKNKGMHIVHDLNASPMYQGSAFNMGRPKPTSASSSEVKNSKGFNNYYVTQHIDGTTIKGTYIDKKALKKDIVEANNKSVNRTLDLAFISEGGMI
jgi:hypothetical protein